MLKEYSTVLTATLLNNKAVINVLCSNIVLFLVNVTDTTKIIGINSNKYLISSTKILTF